MYPSLVPISVKTQLYIGYSTFHDMVEKAGNDLVVRGRLSVLTCWWVVIFLVLPKVITPNHHNEFTQLNTFARKLIVLERPVPKFCLYK